MPSHHGRGRRHASSRSRSATPEAALFFGEPEDRGPDRKTLQLCKQTARALSLALGAECGDAVTRDVYVDTVTPAPDASRLLVTVRPVTPDIDPDAVLARLNELRPRLRISVAATICRKRVPELAFCVAAAGEEP
jgi:ribosome-binding factor A